MSTNQRFEISSSSPDSNPQEPTNQRFGYTNPHRSHFSGSSSGPNLERSSSFRESHDSGNRTVTPGGGSGPSFPSPNSAAVHGELLPMSQVLSLEVISSGEQKYARQLELRRATEAAMAANGEATGNLQQKPLEQQSLEELKRIKSSLQENAARARDRSRTLAEAISKLEKYRNSLQLRKRARAEASGHERPIAAASGERPGSNAVTPSNSSKSTFCASPSHTGITEGGVPKPDEKGKSAVPNKRMRTSMQDVRLESRTGTANFQRSCGLSDRDRDSLKPGVAIPDDKDRLASVGGEGWEKTKTKGRRSATKSESVIASPAPAVTELEREHKWGAQHRSNVENRPRQSEGTSFRSGPVHGVVSMHKSGVRNESDCAPPVGDKGDRFIFPEKDRSLLKSGAKLLPKEEGPLLGPTPVTKTKVARAPRTGTAVSMNPVSHTPRPHSSDVWDRQAAATPATAAAPSRAQIPIAPSNRKRPAPTRSSSPPVTQWGGQRSQKMSRIARRMNVQSPVGLSGLGRSDPMPSADGDTLRESMGAPTGVRSNANTSPATGLVKKITSTATLSQIKSKTERVTSPAGLSDSDDSDGGDVKSKEKWKKHGDTEGRFAAINQKIAPLFSPGKKSRIGSKEEGGDGIRRQGRSGRAVIQVRESSSLTHVEKVDPAANAKQLRSARPGVDKLEKSIDVKPGRPPTKKGGVDRKAITRPRRPTISGAGDVSESEDDHEEIVAAVHATVNASVGACSSAFWKEMEPFFEYLTQDARESLRLQIKARELDEEDMLSVNLTSDTKMEKVDSTTTGQGSHSSNGKTEINGGSMSLVLKGFTKEPVSDVAVLGQCWPLVKPLPLSQRLLAALIIEEDLDDESRDDGSLLDVHFCAADGYSHDPSDSEQAGIDKEHDSESEVETKKGDNGKFNGWRRSPYQSSYTSNGHRHWDSESELLNSPAKSEVRKDEDRQSSDINVMSKSDGRYQTLPLDERIALELQSIGLYPDCSELAVREDNQVAEELKKSSLDLTELVKKNKERLSLLERIVSNLREGEERDREKLAMRKLIENVFTKRLGSRGGMLGVSGSKSAALKAGRAAALSVAKRSLARFKHFIETGESCFTEPTLREVLFCLSSKDSTPNSGVNTVGLSLIGPLELSLAASASTRWVCHTSGVHRTEKDSCDSDRAAAGTPSERSGDRDDNWCTRSKEREVLLEDVVGSGSVASVPCGTKGKRSEREVGSSKGAGRQGLGGTIKGERKNKTKPRQKTAPLLKAVNGLLGKPSESSEKPSVRVKQEVGLGGGGAQGDGEGPLDLTHLQIPGMDDLVGSGDLAGQGQDLGSWLDFDDPGLPDAGGDFMGLDVPMDDLADLAMMM